jgi:ATP-dependent DNA helicase DinG
LRLADGLERLASALKRLCGVLRSRLEDPENPPEPGLRQRLDATIRNLDRRGELQVAAWSRLLRDLGEPPRAETVEWLALDRIDGLEFDVGVNRNWVDPGVPFAALVARPAHGLVVTSATLTDDVADPEQAWRGAEAITGLRHLPASPAAARIASPFDYAAQTRIFVITDIPRDDIGQVAAAYAALFVAARGGALGLFTAVARLRAVHQRIARLSKRAASRCSPNTLTRCLQRLSSTLFVPRRTLACSAPTPCATASTSRDARCDCWSSTGFPGPAPTYCTGPVSRFSAVPNMASGSPGCGCGRPMAG